MDQWVPADKYRSVAASIAHETSQLCLDEMQVTDIANAMILRRLISILFNLNVILVTTSNRPPWKLYEGGINRNSFIPFITTIQERLVLVGMSGVHDYRKEEETTTTTTNTNNSSLVSTCHYYQGIYVHPLNHLPQYDNSSLMIGLVLLLVVAMVVVILNLKQCPLQWVDLFI
jgi:predicted ATPase